MSIPSSHSMPVAVCAVVALAITGCSTPVTCPDSDLISLEKLEPSQPTAHDESKARGSRGGGFEAPPATPPDEELLDILAQPHWIRSVSIAGQEEPQYRWIYPALEERLLPDATSRHELQSQLRSPEPIVSANAAIGLLRTGYLEVGAPLARAVGSRALDMKVRCAAAEALGSAADAVVLLQQLVDEESNRPRSLYSPSVHAELIRALGRQVPAAESPRVAAALAAREDEVKIAALAAWHESVGAAFPDQGLALRNHRDPTIRTMVLSVLARNPSNETLNHLTFALSDPELQVRTAAIQAMGTLGDTRAVATLEPLMVDGVVGERIAVVKALADLGQTEAAIGAVDDKSWRVRLALAEALPTLPGGPDPDVAKRLLDDPSAEVQYQAVTAIENWPPAIAEPLLLRTLQQGTYRSQELAAESLAKTWPEGRVLLEAFPVGQPPKLRDKALAEIRKAYADRQVETERPRRSQETSISPERLVPVVSALQTLQSTSDQTREHAEAVASLRRVGPGLAEVLEYLVDRQGIVVPSAAFGVLADQIPDFALVERLRQEDVQTRRDAAKQLAQAPARHRFSSLLIHRLADLAVTETDAVVWQYLLSALADRSDGQTFRLAYAATSHDSSGIRQAACEYLRRHPDPQHEAVLTATLNDASVPVVCAAVEALGLCGGNVDPAPVLQLLNSQSESVRISASTALVRLGRPEGAAALERLAHSHDNQTRLRVAQVMGELGLSEFAPTLIRMLDDRHGIRLAALNSLPKVADCEEAANFDLHESQRVAAWRRWAGRENTTTR